MFSVDFMAKSSFILACLIYLLNSIGNVSQGIFIKYFQQTNGINLYHLITLKCIVISVILFPFVLKNLRYFYNKLHIVILLAALYASDMIFYNNGLKGISANTATIILLMVPFWIIVFGRFILKEHKFNKVNAACIFICLLAIFSTLFGEIKIEGFNNGYIYVFIDSLIIPLSLVLQKKFNDCRPVLYAIWTNAIVLGIISFTMSGFTMPEFSKENVFSGFVVAFFDVMECGAVYIAYQMAEIALLQPIRFTRLPIAILMSFFLLNEKLTYLQAIAGIIIVSVNLFSMWYSRKYQSK